MTSLTPILEARPYEIAILVVYGLGGFTLAAHLHARWLNRRNISFMTIHCCILALVVAWGSLLFNPGQLFGRSIVSWVISIPLGLAAGWIAVQSDRRINRYLRRQQLTRGTRLGEARRTGGGQIRDGQPALVRTLPLAMERQVARRRTIGIVKMKENFQPSSEDRQFGLWPILVAAVLEEWVYRGLLVVTCFLLPHMALTVMVLIGTILAFSLSHIFFGWSQVLAKAPMGLLALGVVLLSGSILSAIIVHVFFNLEIWRDIVAQPVFTGRTGNFGTQLVDSHRNGVRKGREW